MGAGTRRQRLTAMQPLDPLLLELYRAARDHETPEFQDFVLRRLRSLFDFQSAIWGGFRRSSEGLTIVDAHLHDIDPDSVTEWIAAGFQLRDKAPKLCMDQPGVAHRIHASRAFASAEDADLRDFARRFSRENFLVETMPEGNDEQGTWVSLYRADADALFDDAEAAMFERLMPHLSEALRINRLLSPGIANRDRRVGLGSGDGLMVDPPTALADSGGRIHFADRMFLDLLRREWSECSGAVLPDPLHQMLSDGRSAQYVGNRLVIAIRRAAGMVMLRARPKSQLDSLSPQRARIAWLFGVGHSHKYIGRQLGISPATVRNHLVTVYAELGIHSKEQLIGIVKGETS